MASGRGLAQRRESDGRRNQGREAAHDRIGDREIGVAIKPPDQQEIEDMGEGRGQDERRSRGRGPWERQTGHESRHAAPERHGSGSQEFVPALLTSEFHSA
jgi:hypothetical protein